MFNKIFNRKYYKSLSYIDNEIEQLGANEYIARILVKGAEFQADDIHAYADRCHIKRELLIELRKDLEALFH